MLLLSMQAEQQVVIPEAEKISIVNPLSGTPYPEQKMNTIGQWLEEYSSDGACNMRITYSPPATSGEEPTPQAKDITFESPEDITTFLANDVDRSQPINLVRSDWGPVYEALQTYLGYENMMHSEIMEQLTDDHKPHSSQ